MPGACFGILGLTQTARNQARVDFQIYGVNAHLTDTSQRED